MAAYIVRLKTNKELVGFYAADEMEQLFHLVDEVTSPGECEAKEISSGGIAWGSQIATRIPMLVDEDGEPAEGQDLTGDFSLTESWGSELFDRDPSEWMSICP